MPLKMFELNKKAPSHSKITHVIAVAAGKGGVGKSTITVNLAIALRRAGYSIGIMDTDIYGPSIRRMLREDSLPKQNGELIIPAFCQGIKMISMAYFRHETESAAVRAPVANGVVTQFIKNVEWGNLDFLLIDFPPGTGDIQLTLSQQANLTGAVMVTTPQEVAVMDVRKAVNLFHQVNIPVLGIVENMSYYYHQATEEKIYLFGKNGGEDLAQEIGAPFLGNIPIDPEVCRCGDEGHGLLIENGCLSPAAQAFEELAKNFVAQVELQRRLSKECLTSFELVWKDMS